MPSASTELGRYLRILLQGSPNDNRILENVVPQVDAFVAQIRSGEVDTEQLRSVEDELQSLHNEIVSRSDSSYQTELLLQLLYHLSPALSSSSIISEWFDTCLRPALRESTLPYEAVRHAKDIVLAALHKPAEQYSKLVTDFRRRLLDLYLRDALDEGSEVDILEWAEMDQGERAAKSAWKANLEDILITYATEQPSGILDEFNDEYFRKPSHRLQLLNFLNILTSHSSFVLEVSPILAVHPVMENLLYSLQLDNSSPGCILALAITVKIIPMFAQSATETLKSLLPHFLAVLARILCFDANHAIESQDDTSLESGDEEAEDDQIHRSSTRARTGSLQPRADLKWRMLEQISTNATALPSPTQLFGILYYLYPSNVIGFLRSPINYLETREIPSPYEQAWTDVFDEMMVKSKVEGLLGSYVLHGALLFGGAEQELAHEGRWAQYELSRIVSESTMLDVRNARLALGERQVPGKSAFPTDDSHTPRVDILNMKEVRKPTIAMDEIVSTSRLLRSGQEIEIIGPASKSPLSSHYSGTRSLSLPPEKDGHSKDDRAREESSSRLVGIMASLQRDVVLLRNELNLELWINRENAKHIGRMYEEHILSANAEVERQALHNRLRQYKTRVSTLQKSSASVAKSASSAQEKYLKWNQDLQSKLQARREQARTFDSETATLRAENSELRAKLDAQGRLLESATHRVFLLETQIKETAHKVDRLRDYERRIDQLTATQVLWDDDVQKLKDQKEHMAVMLHDFKGMQLRLESHQYTQELLRKELISAQDRARDLEIQLTERPVPTRSLIAAEIAEASGERKKLEKENSVLRRRTRDLRDGVERLKAQLETVESGREATAPSAPKSNT